jgi:hypothetical protein
MKSAEECTYETVYSKEEDGYIATCKEFPSLSWIHCKKDKSLEGIKKLVQEVIEDINNG